MSNKDKKPPVGQRRQVSDEEVSRVAKKFAEDLHPQTLSFALDRTVQKGETVFLVKESTPERVLAVHRALAATIARWRHHLRICGIPDNVITYNEHVGLEAGAADNAIDDAANQPPKNIIKPD